MTVGILLVGGFGTRLAPLTNVTPKPMLPIANLPVTEHQLLVAKAAGITKATRCDDADTIQFCFFDQDGTGEWISCSSSSQPNLPRVPTGTNQNQPMTG